MDKPVLGNEITSGINLFTAWMESRLAYKGIPGAAVGLVFDQDLLWAKGYGYADIANKKYVTPQTLFRIASITKLITSTAILQLRDEKKLRLDDPVGSFLPWFSFQQEIDSPPVLIKHLLTHTSGLPRESVFPYWDTGEFPTYEDVRQNFVNQEQIYRTETRWKYSNLAFTILGEVISAVSGMEYEDYVEEKIFLPLEMKDSYIRTVPKNHPSLALPYGRRWPNETRSVRPFTDCKGITPAANMTTNLYDLAKFAMLQFRMGPAKGKQILSGHTIKEMHTVHWLDDSWEYGWGWGFEVSRINEKTYVGHTGSLMGFRSYMLLCPAEKIGVIVFTNSDDGEPEVITKKVFEWIAPSVISQFKPSVSKKEVNPFWEKLLGRYRSPSGDLQVLIYNNELIIVDPTLDNPLSNITKLTPITDLSYIREKKDGFDNPGEKLYFEFDEDGKVTRIVSGVSYIYPIENWS